jgi:hypothetical protein
MMDQFGVEAVERRNVMPRGGRSDTGVANWTGEQSKTLREQATLKDWGQKIQAWG